MTMHEVLAALLFAASALATQSPDATVTGQLVDTGINPYADASASVAAIIAEIPSSVLTVMETAIPASWQGEILTNPDFRSSVVSAAAAGTYPAWLNDLPNNVKAWATSNFDVQIVGVPSTTQDTASETSSSVTVTSKSFSQSALNAAQTTLPDSSSDTTPSSGSGSGSSSSSSSASDSVSSSKSTGGAPAPSGGSAMGVAGAAGIFVLGLAL